jgi:hypothetical protein
MVVAMVAVSGCLLATEEEATQTTTSPPLFALNLDALYTPIKT